MKTTVMDLDARPAIRAGYTRAPNTLAQALTRVATLEIQMQGSRHGYRILKRRSVASRPIR
jgi:hypothetical protein